MKTPKNFEALFLAAALMATVASYAAAEVPARAAPISARAASTAPQMQVVVIKGQRLTAAQKAAL